MVPSPARSSGQYRPYNKTYGPRKQFNEHSNKEPGVCIQENIPLKDIREGNVSTRVTRIIECLSAAIADKVENSGYVSLNISINYKTTPGSREITKEANNTNVSEEVPEDDEKVMGDLEAALLKSLEKRKQLAAELPEKVKKLRDAKSKLNEVKAELLKDNCEDVDRSNIYSDLVNLWKTPNKTDCSSEETTKAKANQAPDKQVEDVASATNNSAKKSKKNRKSKDGNLNISIAEQVSKKSEDVAQPPSNKKSKVELIQTPEGKSNTKSSKRHKKNNQSNSEITPNQTPDMQNPLTDSGKKSSKKKRKSQALQESTEYLPFTP